MSFLLDQLYGYDRLPDNGIRITDGRGGEKRPRLYYDKYSRDDDYFNRTNHVDSELHYDPPSFKIWAGVSYFSNLQEARAALFSLMSRSERGCLSRMYVASSLYMYDGDKSNDTTVKRALKKTLSGVIGGGIGSGQKQANDGMTSPKQENGVDDKKQQVDPKMTGGKMTRMDRLKLVADIMQVTVRCLSPISVKSALESMELWLKVVDNGCRPAKDMWFTRLETNYLNRSSPLDWLFMVRDGRQTSSSSGGGGGGMSDCREILDVSSSSSISSVPQLPRAKELLEIVIVFDRSKFKSQSTNK